MRNVRSLNIAAVVASACIAWPALAADYPASKEGTFNARDFRFSTGDVMPEVRLHYTTIGEPTGQPVLILYGTAGMAKFWKQQLQELLQSAPRRTM
jgi:homoserine O-acetyltransferase